MNQLIKKIGIVLLVCIALTLLIFIDARFIEPEKIVVTKNTYNLTGSNSNPIKIVLISDIHIGSEKPGALEKKVRLINDQEPDIILIAGDFINSEKDEIQKLKPLKDLNPKYGTYAVLGNHDYNLWVPEIRGNISDPLLAEMVFEELQSYNITVLRNQFQKISLKGKKLELYGSDDLWSGKSKYFESNLGLPKIILVHERIAINEHEIANKALILSGHTHCGEVRIPIVTQYIMQNILSGFGDVIGGWHIRNDRVDDYVTCGLTRGTSGFRFLSNPEISIIELY